MGTGVRLVAAIVTIALVGAACASSSASPAGASPAVASPAGASPAGASPARSSPVPTVGVSPTGASSGASVGVGSVDPSAASSSASLIVLADGVQGGIGLWRFQAPDKWTAIGATPGATAVARTVDGVVLVAGRNVELRSAADLARTAATIRLEWPASASSQSVVAGNRAPRGD